MLIIGKISGIQAFVTNVAHVGGGQAKRLRARSFYAQMLCDAAAVKILNAVGVKTLDPAHFLMSAAGHFVLRIDDVAENEEVLRRQESEMNEWLLSNLSGEIRLSLGWTSSGGSETRRYLLAHRELTRKSLRPWASVVAPTGAWDQQLLILKPLDKPCELCGQRKGEINELDERTSEPQWVCRLCDKLKEVGGVMTRAKWLAITRSQPARSASVASISAFGLNVELGPFIPSPHVTLAIASLDESISQTEPSPFSGRWLTRTLARHVPIDPESHSTIDFQEIAAKSIGDCKLGILKADGDNLGAFWTSIFEADEDLIRYGAISKKFDDFSAGEINQLIAKAVGDRARWNYIYTIFSGGDDLFFLGPWDVILDFAAEVNRIFRFRFASERLTLSAGVAIVKPGWPIRRVAQIATDLLKKAKSIPASEGDEPKDQMATLGTIWKWDHHQEIIEEGKLWASWVDQEVLDRGWLKRIRDLNEAQVALRRDRKSGLNTDRANSTTKDRANRLMASAHLCYSVERLLQTSRAARECSSLFARLKGLVEEFESSETTRSRYLSAVLYYAILSTRKPAAEDRNGLE